MPDFGVFQETLARVVKEFGIIESEDQMPRGRRSKTNPKGWEWSG